MYLPKELTYFLRQAGVLKEAFYYDIEATAAGANLEDRDELRAEYLFKPSSLDTRIDLKKNLRALFTLLDKEFFGNRLSDLFLHKDPTLSHYFSLEPSWLVSQQHIKYKLSRLLFSRYLHSAKYYYILEEDIASYPLVIFWVLAFPFFLFFQGMYYTYL